MASDLPYALGGARVGAEVVLSREVTVHGENLVGQLTQPIAEMKQELATKGCSEFSLAYWSVNGPTRLHVEVRCAEWVREVPLDLGKDTENVSQGFDGGSAR